MTLFLGKNDNDEKINIFYVLEAICGAGACAFEMIDKSNWASLLFNASFVIVAAQFFMYLLAKKIHQREFINILFYITMIALAFACVSSVTKESMSFDYMKKYIIFCVVFLMLFIVTEEKVNKKTMNVIIAIFYALAIFFIVFFFFFGGSTKTNGKKYSTAITMGLSNGNLTGMWLGTMIYFVFFAMHRVKNIIFKIASIFFIGLLVYMITVTECRNALVSLVLTLIIYLIYRLKQNKKISNAVLLIIILLPLMFVGLYYALLDTDYVDYLEFLVHEGKELTSRVHIWEKALDAIKGVTLLTGDYYEISDGTGESQLHNISLDSLASYGLVVFILTIVYLYKMLKLAVEQQDKKEMNMGLICFIGVWLFGLGEAGFITGGSGMYLPACLMFAFAFYDIKEDTDDKKVKITGEK